MKTWIVALGLVVLGAAGGAGYYIGARNGGATAQQATVGAAAGGATGVAANGATGAAVPRRILYYRNPMGLADTSPTPKKDPMGMDYIAVYEGEEPAADPASVGQVRIGPEKIQKLGVRTEAVALRAMGRTLRAAGRVAPDERRIALVVPKFEGYVERLHVNATGQPVARGQPLLDAYSPEMVSAQREYAIAAQAAQAMQAAGSDAAAGMTQLADAALARLRNWDLAADDVAALVRSGQVQRRVTLRSPVAGIVTEKKAFQGMRFAPGEALYQITDLASVWVLADVAERDIGLVATGAKASVTLPAFPGQAFPGRVAYVYPTLDAQTRTVPVRIELANPRGMLRPAMFAQVELDAGDPAPVLAVAESAVLDSGTRTVVLVQRGEGRFEPRAVRLGRRGGEHAEVLDGLKAGEQVVVAANFLIDAESNLKAALGAMGAPPAGAAAPPGAPAASSAPAAGAASAVVHRATGSVESVDAKAGVVTLEHAPVATLGWPAMTMEFKAANPALLAGLAPGAKLAFEFVERAPGEWVVTRVAPLAGAAPAAQPRAASHGGH